MSTAEECGTWPPHLQRLVFRELCVKGGARGVSHMGATLQVEASVKMHKK